VFRWQEYEEIKKEKRRQGCILEEILKMTLGLLHEGHATNAEFGKINLNYVKNIPYLWRNKHNVYIL